MASCNQIEAYPLFAINEIEKFKKFVHDSLLLITDDKNTVDELIDSIKLVTEGFENNFSFKQTSLKVSLGLDVELRWYVNMFCWPHEERTFELSLEVEDEQILIRNHDSWPQYNSKIIGAIFETMQKIASLKQQTLVLFTDEASDGVFFHNIKKNVKDINYLFEFAIIPDDISWNPPLNKYYLVAKTNEQKYYTSRSKYMSDYNNINFS